MTFINNKFLEKIYYLITKKRQKKINLKEVKNILSKLGNKKKELTKEQKKKIDDFYMKNYENIARPFWTKNLWGEKVGDYSYIKEVLGY